jgi:hypothetical protein
MSNQFSSQPIDPPDSDSDRLRTLLDNLNNLKSKLHHFTVIDELGQPLGVIRDLILDEGHQLNLVLDLADAGLGGAPVLLNGRRIKKVSVQTQSVFVDITKADTQFLPEYSSAENRSSLHSFEQPLPSPAFAEPFADLNFSEEPSQSFASFNEENFTYPTDADRELAESLFTTEPDESAVTAESSLSQEWELSTPNSPEDTFSGWNEEFSSVDLFGSTEELTLSEPTADLSTASLSFESEPTSESLANELERLDLNLDNDWSELGSVSATEDTSNSFELSVESEAIAEPSPVFEIGEFGGSFEEPILPDQSVNPFAGEILDLSSDVSSASSDGLAELDWRDTPAIEEPTNFTLEQEDFSFDLPTAVPEDFSLDLPPTVPADLSEGPSIDLSGLDLLSPDTTELSLEWDEAAQVLELGEPEAAFEASSLNLEEPALSQPDTIQSLGELDIFSDSPSPVEETSTFEEFTPPFLEETGSPTSSYEYEQPAAPVLNEPAENQNDWLAAAGVGAAGLVGGMAGASAWNQEPAANSPEENVVGASASEESDAMIPLLEEQLNVEYQRRKVGEVIIRKQIETRMVQVPVRYEKLVIEQVSPERKSLAEVDLSQGALDNIELTGVEQKPTVSGDFASPAVASQALDAIAKALQNRCKRVRIEIELEDGQMQQAYQDWFDECSQL